jgi:hypothetical protein
MGAGIKAWLQGNLSVTDPVGALVDEAIARAEAKERLVQEERLRPAPGVPVAVQHQTVDVSIPTTRPTPERGGGVLTWSYCVTTVPARLHTLLPRTLASLATGGFDEPRLVVDSCDDPAPYRATWPRLPVTCRGPANSPVRTAGNWVLALYEIYLRNPSADRYAVFQDDLVTAPGLRAYLEKVPYPLDGRCYLNLYTFPANQELCPKDKQGNPRVGWYESNQLGRGAVALVFSQEAVEELLSSRYLARRPKDPNRGHKAVDGGIVEAMKKVGFKEMVHNPGLVQHTGVVSSMGNRPHQQCPSFPGEGFDLTTLLTTSRAA